jgi:serine protease
MTSRLAHFTRLALLFAAAALPAVLPATAHSERGPLRATPLISEEDPAGARVIVKYKALGSLMRTVQATGVGEAAKGPQFAARMAQRLGMALSDGRIIDARSQVVQGDKSLSSAALAARLAADPEVEYAVPDLRRHALAAPNDPLFAASGSISPAAGQWYLRAPDATFVSATNALAAWALTTGSTSIVVADVDTGVRFEHPDLTAKLLPGYDFITSTSTSGNGLSRNADASDPGDWTTAGQCGSGQAAENSSWHGTQTSGLIGAQTNNGVGMASMGYNVMVLPVRVLGKCGGTDSDIIAGMLWAGGVSSNPVANPHPARVINLSLGGTGSCTAAYADAISQLTAAGVVVVAAAGNAEGLAVGVPANCTGVIAVAGVRHVGTKVGFSSIGPEVALAAPAGNCVNSTGACLYPILSTTNSGTTGPVASTYSDSTNYSVGTSFSSPLVAGTAALMLSVNPALTPAQVKSLLQGSARTFPATSTDTTVLQCRAPNGVPQDECICTTSTCGAGLLDAGAAVAAAAGTARPVAVVTPSATTVLVGTSVGFDGSASSVPSGRTVSSWQWTLTSGSTIAAFSGATNAATARVVASAAGSYTVQLTVTDSSGQQASASQTVTVNAPAAPTVALTASATTVAAGSTVSFDSAGSAAASGFAIASYQWSITSGAGLASFTSSSNAATATVATAGNGSGSFTVQLTVTDSLGQSASRSQTVNVTAVTPTASITASTTTLTAGNSATFDGSGSTAPAGRTLRSYLWTLTSGSNIAAFSGSTTGSTATVAASASGSFTVQLTVTDSAGATDTRSTTVTVNAATVTVTGSGSGGSSGGGGAMSVGWLALLALAVAWLFRGARHRA